jgi:hypothetical protein
MQSMISIGPGAIQTRYEKLVRRKSRLVDDNRVLLLKMRTTLLAITLLVAGLFALDTLVRWAELGRLPLSLDFNLYRASAIQGMTFGWNHLYDVVAQKKVYDALVAAYPSLGPMLSIPNVYSPPVSWLGVPFTYLPLTTGYLIWSVLVLVTTAIAFVALAPGGLLAKLVQLVLAFCPYLVLLSLSEGQVTSFQIAGIAACWWLMKRGRDGWAGIALVPLVLKPQTMVLVPLTILAAGRFRTFWAWLVGTAVVGLAVLVNIGLDGSIAYVQRLQYASANPGQYWLGSWYNLSLHFSSRVGRFGADVLAVSLALWVAWRHRRAGPEVPLAAGLIGSLLVASYLHLNDLITLIPAGWLVLRAYPRWWLWILMIGGYAVALECTDLGTARWGEGLLLFEISVLMALAMIAAQEHPGHQVAEAGEVDAHSERDPVPLAAVGLG